MFCHKSLCPNNPCLIVNLVLVAVVFALPSPSFLVGPEILSSDTVSLSVLLSGCSSESDTNLKDLETYCGQPFFKSNFAGCTDCSYSRIHRARLLELSAEAELWHFCIELQTALQILDSLNNDAHLLNIWKVLGLTGLS